MSTVDIVSAIGVAANVIMAGVAALALNTWKKQIAGESQHDLAKRLSGVLCRVAIARDEAIVNLGAVLEGESRRQVYAGLIAETYLPENARVLADAVASLAALEGEVAVLWDEGAVAVIETIRVESSRLARYLQARVSGTKRLEDVVDLLQYSAPTIAPTFTLGTYKWDLDELTKLVQQWLAPHVGRKGKHVTDSQTVSALRSRIRDEAVQRADVERRKLKSLALQQLQKSDADPTE